MTTPPSLIGAQLGPYQIQSLLGSGGMASVYQGLDTHLQRPVAIKVLSAALAGDADYVRRFKREAQLIASLRHPNVAQVYAFGEQDGAPYMVQEILPGPTLEARLQSLAATGQLLPRADVLAVVAQLAAALDAAHAIGVIHRDVKPSNAIANAQGELVLTDFGIARSAADTNLTQPGVVMGTPAYVAPEQAISSAALTPAVDVYALGVLVFQLLTGRLPFEADTPTAVVIKHLYEAAPAPSQLRPDLPPAVDTVVRKALEKEPADRYQGAGELATALAQAWSAAGAPAPASIHSLPTTAWAPPTAAAAPSPAPAPTANVGPTQTFQPGAPPHAPTPRAATPAPVSPATAPPPRRASLLPWLGGALLLLLLVGAVAAWRGGAGAETAPTPAPTALAAAPSAAPTGSASPAPTAASASSPAPEPTVAPSTAPAAPTSAPTDTPAPGVEPVAALGTLLDTGIADGRAGPQGSKMAEHYQQLAEGLSSGDTKRAEEGLRELSKKLEEGLREGKTDAAFGAEAQALLSSIAAQYGLTGN